MAEKIVEGTLIEGFVNTDENPITSKEFTDKFIEWLNINKWSFDGVTKIGIKEK